MFGKGRGVYALQDFEGVGFVEEEGKKMGDRRWALYFTTGAASPSYT